MNKTFAGLALAIIVAAGAGYGVYSSMGGASQPSAENMELTASINNNEADTMAQPAGETAAGEVAAATEPAAAEDKSSADNPVVATVNGEKVYRSDVVDFMEVLPPQMKQMPAESLYPMVIEQVVNAKIVDAKAAKADIEDNPAFQKKMEQAKVQIARATYAEKEIEDNFNEADVKKAYDKMVADMPKVEEVKAAHILVDDEATAKEIIKKLADGGKFADLAKEYSKDKSNAENGGDLGYFAEGDMVKEFGDAAFAMKVGEFSKEPIKTQFGYHIISLEDKRVRPAPAYDDVKDQLTAQVKRDLLNNMMKDWRDSAKVEIYDYNGNPMPAAGEEAPEAAPEAKPAE